MREEAPLPFSRPALHLAHPNKPHHLLGFKLGAKVLATCPSSALYGWTRRVTVATLTMDPEWAPTCSKGPAVEGQCMVLATRRVVNRAKSGGLLIPIMPVMALSDHSALEDQLASPTPWSPHSHPHISLFILINKRMAESDKKGGSQKRVTLPLHSISCPFPLPVHHHHLPQLEKMVVKQSLHNQVPPPIEHDTGSAHASGRKQEKNGKCTKSSQQHSVQQHHPKANPRSREHKTETHWGPRPGSSSTSGGSTHNRKAQGSGMSGNTEEPANQGAENKSCTQSDGTTAKRAGPIKRPVFKEMKKRVVEEEERRPLEAMVKIKNKMLARPQPNKKWPLGLKALQHSVGKMMQSHQINPELAERTRR